ncbi:beta-galactosidase, partial [Streptomyces rubiginosohelvolus]
ELESAGDLVAGLTPDADVAMVYSSASKWALAFQPPLAAPDGGPDRRSYQGLFEPFYRGAFDAGLQVRLLHTDQLTEATAGEAAVRHPVLAAPGLYAVDDATLDWLADYAAAGGHLVLGPRTGYGDPGARARTDVMPARLAEAAGAWYDEFSNLSGDLPVHPAPGSPLPLPDGAAATRWADGVRTDGAQVLASYDHPHFGRWPAVTTHAHGAGRVTYVGTVPDPVLAASLFRWAVPERAGDWRFTQESVTCTGATAADGRRVRFVHNWSWDEAAVRLPAAVR